jgi:hypothetical protein
MFCGPGYFGWHGFFGFPFFGLLIVGLLVWTLVVTARRNRQVATGLATCPGCSRTIDPHWRYCPVCGKGTDTGAGRP